MLSKNNFAVLKYSWFNDMWKYVKEFQLKNNVKS